MGWETRKGRRYYYEAHKVGGRVVKTNCASQAATNLLFDRIDGAQKRHLAAIKALAEVQRLRLPVTQIRQINVGEKQINMAATGAQQVNMAATGAQQVKCRGHSRKARI